MTPWDENGLDKPGVTMKAGICS